MKAVLFDFDGVVVDSSGLKHKLFLKAAAELDPTLVAPLDKALREELVGTERGDVARWVVARKPGASERAYLVRFASLLAEESNRVSLVRGFAEFLGRLVAEKMPVAIVSAAPEGDIRAVLAARGIDAGLFFRIAGSDSGRKPATATAILDALHASGGDVTYYGDMPSDLALAESLGLRFVRLHSDAGALCAWPEGRYATIPHFEAVL